jgi:hypothetical protein
MIKSRQYKQYQALKRRTSTKYSIPETGTVLPPSSAIKIFLYLIITIETPKIKVIT